MVSNGFLSSPAGAAASSAELAEFTGGIRGTEMAEIVVAEATGKCPETETQTD